MLVKQVNLPKFSVDTKALNSYNKYNVIQTKIKYDPVNITFFDDNKNTINKMWYAYYTYYYKDATKPNVKFSGKRGTTPNQNGNNNSTQTTMADYNVSNIYKTDAAGNNDWGYIGETAQPSGPDGRKVPFFQNITVFGFNQHNFTAYTLINPIITNFAHDTYNLSLIHI